MCNFFKVNRSLTDFIARLPTQLGQSHRARRDI